MDTPLKPVLLLKIVQSYLGSMTSPVTDSRVPPLGSLGPSPSRPLGGIPPGPEGRESYIQPHKNTTP